MKTHHVEKDLSKKSHSLIILKSQIIDKKNKGETSPMNQTKKKLYAIILKSKFIKRKQKTMSS